MKTSEYIKSLEDIMNKNGDVKVMVEKPDHFEAAIPYYNRRLNAIIVSV